MRNLKFLAILASCIIIMGCSGSDNPSQSKISADNPDQILSSARQTGSGNRVLLGLWKMIVSADHSSIDAVPLRTGSMHLNVVKFVETAPCTDCLKIISAHKYTEHIYCFTVRLIHPYTNNFNLTAFDVRAIFMTSGVSDFFGDNKLVDWSFGKPLLLNCDGFTSLFNRTDFPSDGTGPAVLKYTPGKLAYGGSLNATMNPYLAFKKDEERRAFLPGAKETQQMFIWLQDTMSPFEFAYAIDASWKNVPETVTDPISQFPPDANCLEAYKVNVFIGNGLTDGGGNAPINVEVFDHQGIETISSVSIECPNFFYSHQMLSEVGPTGSDSVMFSGILTNSSGIGYGDNPILVKVADIKSDPNLGEIDAWQMANAEIKNGWAVTWGDGMAFCNEVLTDSIGSIYAVGAFYGTIDFDPGPGADMHESSTLGPIYDAYLTKFDSQGNFIWARTWGTPGGDSEWAGGVAIDGQDNIYVTGEFMGTFDFDPGPGTDEHTSNGGEDAYLISFDPSGNFRWARTWGGTGWDDAGDVSINNNGLLFVAGEFQDTVDFDPGGGVEEYSFAGVDDAFLSEFDTSGNFKWARTWGGVDYDYASVCNCDDAGNCFTAGGFQGSVDLNPDSGTDIRTADGDDDYFIMKLDSDGNYVWGINWGGRYGNYPGLDMALDHNNSLYLTSSFFGTLDFDPGSGVDNHTSYGYDIFLSKFDSTSGKFEWARTWGLAAGDGGDNTGTGIGIDASGNVLVTGRFQGTNVDFDPGAGVDYHTSEAPYDHFLSKFDTSGNFIWARTWYASRMDAYDYVTSDDSNNIYVGGQFDSFADFDPGLGTDFHPAGHIFTDAFLSKFPPDGNW